MNARRLDLGAFRVGQNWFLLDAHALCVAVVWLLLAFAPAAPVLVEVPPLAGRIVDTAALLSPDQAAALDQKLAAFEAKKGSQIVVLTLPTTQPEDLAAFGIRVADTWKIGRKQVDDGVILIVARDDRAVRVEVGYGLEGAIPDAVAKRVIDEIIVPKFRNGDFGAGVVAGAEQLMKLVDGEPLPAPASTSAPDSDFFILLAAGGMVFGWLLSLAIPRSAAGGVAAVTSGVIGAWVLGMGLLALFIAIFVFASVAAGRGGSGWSDGRGGLGSGGFGGGGFGGGGGGFGGGGASGRW